MAIVTMSIQEGDEKVFLRIEPDIDAACGLAVFDSIRDAETWLTAVDSRWKEHPYYEDILRCLEALKKG